MQGVSDRERRKRGHTDTFGKRADDDGWLVLVSTGVSQRGRDRVSQGREDGSKLSIRYMMHRARLKKR
jgi:hypothetical protein